MVQHVTMLLHIVVRTDNLDLSHSLLFLQQDSMSSFLTLLLRLRLRLLLHLRLLACQEVDRQRRAVVRLMIPYNIPVSGNNCVLS